VVRKQNPLNGDTGGSAPLAAPGGAASLGLPAAKPYDLADYREGIGVYCGRVPPAHFAEHAHLEVTIAVNYEKASAKLAVLNLSKSLSKELDRTGVTVNTVSPGIIATETIRERLTEAAAQEGRSTKWEDVEDHTIRTELDNPTGRMARPEEVADLVAFLCSPRAGYVNGANVRIDGGSNVTVGP